MMPAALHAEERWPRAPRLGEGEAAQYTCVPLVVRISRTSRFRRRTGMVASDARRKEDGRHLDRTSRVGACTLPTGNGAIAKLFPRVHAHPSGRAPTPRVRLWMPVVESRMGGAPGHVPPHACELMCRRLANGISRRHGAIFTSRGAGRIADPPRGYRRTSVAGGFLGSSAHLRTRFC